MPRRIVAAVVAAAASVVASLAVPPPGSTHETDGPDEVAVDSADHRAAVAALDAAEARLADDRARLADLDSRLAEWSLAAEHLRDALPALRARREDAAGQLSAGEDELRRLAAVRYVMVGSGRLTENLFSTDEALGVLRRHLLLDVADDARRGDVEQYDGSLGDAELQLATATRSLAEIGARIAELGAERDRLDAGIQATAAGIPGLIDTVDRTRREALQAMTMAVDTAPPTTADGAAAGDRHVDVVGDSLTASARDELSAVLGRIGSVSIDAVVGRALVGGQKALERIAADDPDIVVIALGTNDVIPGADYGDLVQRTVDITTGARCVVWVDVQEVRAGHAEVNRLIHAAAVDAIAWWSAVAGPPHLHLGDGYHLSAAGQEAFAALVADTVAAACS